MQSVSHCGVTLHIRDEGPRDGRVVMFGNSLGSDLRLWEGLIPLLPEGLRLVRFDKRGHGLSDCPPGPYSIEDLSGDAAAICDALELRDVTFVGLSIGGLIGQSLAARRPDLLRALVLMDTGARIGAPDMWQQRIDAVRRDGIASISDAILARWFAPGFEKATPTTFALCRNMLERGPDEGYAGCCAAIAGADLTESTAKLTLPVMAMAGAQDASTPPDLVRATAALCGAEFHAIADAGHLPCVEKPEVVAALLKDFLGRT
ncbi:MAG: 3-oxoadipate enol-lactonase [Thioclava marina]|uniref:3-oxoadipate enol-lactonase n=1 Tax=Thioclava marina TaxID=1915077 RepID=A0ABX3MN01_9RHOB|nr:3-oxoadipate enol-lactonase [Thioclava marina]MBC7147136.1 3-oxoadipate enol-lactonase [Thioclava marina]OOY12924.1 3-oxoadipate enol-lactonase [Thioclava marina]TNF10307.1 MAG: 3-oxoadipate enol-lactonase [Paracoccaceae bacterium]